MSTWIGHNASQKGVESIVKETRRPSRSQASPPPDETKSEWLRLSRFLRSVK